MTDLLENLEPRTLWRYFLELSTIPRGSRNEAAAASWVAGRGRALGLSVETDHVGNVLIRKPASPGLEGRGGVALQAHVDMVCEKNEGTVHDFAKDPIQVVKDGEVLRARGTTLGADNGVGVAAALAVLSQRDLVHPPLEVLITVDEETGLTGANALRAGWMKATRLLNLDSEEEGELTIGCAGGSDSVATRPVSLVAPSSGRKVHRLKVAGLRGGHSGIDIAAGRGNAIRILAQTLKALERTFDLEVGAVRGGNKRNAIPREASALLYLEPAEEAPVSLEVARILAEWRSALGAFDPNLAISLEPPPSELSDQPGAVLTAPDRSALLGLLLSGPHGVEAMSPDIPGLVQTSTNLGVVETRAHSVEVTFLTRSSIDASKAALSARIAATASLAGFSVTESNGYSGWKPEPSSEVVALVKKVHLELFGKPMVVKAIHAGLECGLIGEKYPGMEMASIGPSMWDVHTPDERVSIGSVQNFWRLLTAILERA